MTKSVDRCSATTDGSNTTDSSNYDFYSGGTLRQYFAAFVVNLSVMNVGCVFSWPATAVPDLLKSQTFSHLTLRQIGWITSISSLSGVIVCPLMGYFIQKLGLRRSMLTLTIPLLIGWILMIFATEFWILITGRFITGFCSGGMAIANPAFVAETADKKVRGRLGFSFQIMCAFGQLYIFFIGALVGWEWQTSACAIIPAIFCLLMIFIPESPKDLISRGKLEEAKKSLAWFRSAPDQNLIQPEFDSMVKHMKEAESNKLKLSRYLSAGIVKPTVMCMILMFLFPAAGSSPTMSYTVQIFEATGTGNSFLATILVGVAQLVTSCAAALYVDRVGRRVLLLVSSFGMAMCMIVLGSYLYWEFSFWRYFPVSILMSYAVLFAAGFGPVPWLIMGEVIPPAAKGYTSAVITGTYRLTAFLILLLFADLVKWLGQAECFWLFGAVGLFATAYIYFQVPETKQKTLAEIQKVYTKALPSDMQYQQV